MEMRPVTLALLPEFRQTWWVFLSIVRLLFQYIERRINFASETTDLNIYQMKTKLLLLLFASFALPAAAWHVADNGDLVEDFENAEDDLDNGIHKYSFQTHNLIKVEGAPTLSLLEVRTTDDGSNHYLFAKNGWSNDYSSYGNSQIAEINVTLPGGKSLQDYKSLKLNFKNFTPKENDATQIDTWASTTLFLAYAKQGSEDVTPSAEADGPQKIITSAPGDGNADTSYFEIQRTSQYADSFTDNTREFPIKDGYVNEWSNLYPIHPRQLSGNLVLGFRLNTNTARVQYGLDNITLVSNQPQTTGVDEVAVSSDEGFEIDGAGIVCDTTTSVYTISGALVASGAGRIELRPGCYVAVCGGKATKFVIL